MRDQKVPPPPADALFFTQRDTCALLRCGKSRHTQYVLNGWIRRVRSGGRTYDVKASVYETAQAIIDGIDPMRVTRAMSDARRRAG